MDVVSSLHSPTPAHVGAVRSTVLTFVLGERTQVLSGFAPSFIPLAGIERQGDWVYRRKPSQRRAPFRAMQREHAGRRRRLRPHCSTV
jgi:hypothetical protein